MSLDDIDAFVGEGREEDLHLDFKLVKDSGLDKEDRRTFAKAVSEFANSDGGLIVWGIDARKNADLNRNSAAVHRRLRNHRSGFEVDEAALALAGRVSSTPLCV